MIGYLLQMKRTNRDVSWIWFHYKNMIAYYEKLSMKNRYIMNYLLMLGKIRDLCQTQI